MPSVGTGYAQRKSKKLIALASAGYIFTNAQMNAALNASGYSATPTRIGVRSGAATTTADSLGSMVVFATDADLGNLFEVATVGLDASGNSILLTQYETVTVMGRTLKVGTLNFPDLLTFTRVKRSDRGSTVNNGDLGTSGTEQSTYWVLTESRAALSADGANLNGATRAKVGVVPA